MKLLHSFRRRRPHAGARHVATMLAAILAIAVVGWGTIAIARVSSFRAGAADASHRIEDIASLGTALQRFDAADQLLKGAAATPTIDVAGSALAEGFDAATRNAASWRTIRGAPEFDPATVARIDAWYASDLRAQVGQAGTVNTPSIDLEASRAYMLTTIDKVQVDLQRLYDDAVAQLSGSLEARKAAAGTELLAVSIATAVALLGALVLGGFVSRGERRRIRRELRGSSREQLESSVKRALSMIDTEEEALAVLVRAGQARSHGPVTALLSDSSRAHFQRSGDEVAACRVESPVACPAARQGQTMLFASSDNLDTCPNLRPLDGMACGAICVPMAVEGTTIGVLHHQTAAGDIDHDLVTELELIAGETSHRIGMVRNLGVSRTQASTDPLTGLPNRRHLEERLRSLKSANVEIALAFADLDHFKTLNDLHGHETGDRALTLFAAACRDALRKGDFVARVGGEEFVMVLPGCEEDAAREILDRLRAGPGRRLRGRRLPPLHLQLRLGDRRTRGVDRQRVAARRRRPAEGQARRP